MQRFTLKFNTAGGRAEATYDATTDRVAIHSKRREEENKRTTCSAALLDLRHHWCSLRVSSKLGNEIMSPKWLLLFCLATSTIGFEFEIPKSLLKRCYKRYFLCGTPPNSTRKLKSVNSVSPSPSLEAPCCPNQCKSKDLSVLSGANCGWTAWTPSSVP